MEQRRNDGQGEKEEGEGHGGAGEGGARGKKKATFVCVGGDEDFVSEVLTGVQELLSSFTTSGEKVITS